MTFSAATSLAVFFGMFAVARGFLPLVKFGREFQSCAIKAIVLLSISYILRSGYWDVLQWVLPRENWVVVRDFFGGQNMSSAFNAIVVVAVYYLLSARYYLIPDDERAGWHWWNAFLHPSGSCMNLWRANK